MKIPLLVLLYIVSACSSEGFQSTGPKVSSPKKNNAAAAEQTGASSAKKGVTSSAAPESVSEKLFNVAILTQSVQCLFCHMKIEGDVGGIDFPADRAMHNRAGEGLRILGTLYGTNSVPRLVSEAPKARTVKPNYANTELKIFPTTKDDKGNIVFPVVAKELLAGKTKGTLKFAGRTVQNSVQGNLTVLSDASPIELDGEIYIDGDLIIGGNYRGLGTIYARNIFIVRDLKAVSSAFPFAADPLAAKEQAKQRIAAKSDGLYMFALGQITVGYPDPMFLGNSGWRRPARVDNPNTVSQPPGGIAAYTALAEPKNCPVMNGHSSTYKSVLVNRVDAFLYSSDYLLWRTCNNFELNGGFVAPDVALVNAGDADIPNAEPVNLVRYDYRLRAGVKAFSVLKNFFEQE